MDSIKFKTTDEYIKSMPGNLQPLLEEIRAYIKEAAPKAEEVISYNMPAYKQGGILVYFAGNKKHIGFYPTASPIIAFADELVEYATSKGAIQFPIEKPIPKDLVQRIVKFKIDELADKERLKKKKLE